MAGIPRYDRSSFDLASTASRWSPSFFAMTPTSILRGQLVNERMREAESLDPPQYGKRRFGPVSSGLGEIFQFTVKNDALTLMQLEEVLDWQIAPALRTVPGIVEVNSFGGEEKQYQVMLDPKRLQASGCLHRASR